MKALLLAAGLGTRIKDIAKDIPKCLIDVGGKPLLYIWLDALEKYDVQEVIINTHFMADKVEKAVMQRNSNLNIVLSYEENLLGSGGTIYKNREILRNEEEFYYIMADNLTNINLNKLYLYHKTKNSLFTIFVYKTDNPKQKGIVQVDESGRITNFEEKPILPMSNLANSGIGILKSSVIDLIEDSKFVDFSKEIMPKLINKMYAYSDDSYIKDIGTPDDYFSSIKDWQKIKHI